MKHLGLQENISLHEGINFITQPTLVLSLVSFLEFPNVLKQEIKDITQQIQFSLTEES